MRRPFLSFLFAAFAFSFAPSSKADDLTLTAAALVGYGTITSDLACGPNGETCNPFGVGVGVRAGVTLPVHLYLGGTLVYHFGYSKDFGGGETISEHILYPGIEGGYDFVLGPITLRPYLGVGAAFETLNGALPANGNVPALSTNITQQQFAVWPGAVGYVSFSRFFAGIDARYFFTNDPGSSAPCFFGTFGVKIL